MPAVCRHSHSVPPAAKRIKVPDAPRARSAPATFNPERYFRAVRRERDRRWTPSFADKPSAGSYDFDPADKPSPRLSPSVTLARLGGK